MGDGGKGSSPRPYSVSQEEFANNWDAIFSKKKKDYKEVQQDMTELNGDGFGNGGRNGEDNDKSNSSV